MHRGWCSTRHGRIPGVVTNVGVPDLLRGGCADKLTEPDEYAGQGASNVP